MGVQVATYRARHDFRQVVDQVQAALLQGFGPHIMGFFGH
jgi:hypothetical protein